MTDFFSRINADFPNVIDNLRWQLAQKLELTWWRRYLRRKSPAAYLSEKRDYWERLLHELEWDIVDGQRALDAGCGPAGIFLLLHERQRITAIDPLLDRYDAELPVFAKDDYPDVKFITSSLESIDLHKFASFDLIYCFNAINHVSDWDRSLDALTSAARPGTRMILSSDVHRHGWLLPVFRALPGDALHPQQHGPRAYREALGKRGWKIERERVLRRETIFDYTAWICTFTP